MRTSLILAAAVMTLAAPRHPAAQQPCPAPRVSQWSSIRDTLWPLVRHVEGDQAWAHVGPPGLPRGSETWCNPLQNDAQAVAAGRDLYRSQCAECHGEAGRGDGPSALDGEPQPPDLTQALFAGMREPPGPATHYAILARGIAGTPMPAFRELSGWERLAVIAYVTQLPGPDATRVSRAWADTLRSRRRP